MDSKYNQIKDLSQDQFKRLTGVKKVTFDKMVELLTISYKNKRFRGGRNTKLCIEDILLMMLEYLREYRTYFHISQSYNISESSAYKNIKWAEDVLSKSSEFSLPKRKEELSSNIDIEVVLVDVTESPIQRPKKSKNNIIQERRDIIQ